MAAASPEDLTRATELTMFAPDASLADVQKLCAAARDHRVFAVCLNSSRVELARTLLDDTIVQIVALVGFPFGAADSDAKRYETEIAVDLGAHEVDFVLNVGRLKDGDSKYVLREMRDIVESADERPVKVILETHLLTRDEQILACKLALDSGVQFVSASTGFHAPATTPDEIKFLRETAGAEIGIKGSCESQDVAIATSLLDAGATRIGSICGLTVPIHQSS